MYTESIPFEQNMPVAFDAYKVAYYHLHSHERVVEVLLLLRGSARVKVSFEEFDLKEGDYILINAGDSHSIYATDSKCEAASLYFNMAAYREAIPYLEYVLFACESFDLVKYKNETQTLRKMIANLLLSLAKNRPDPQDPAFLQNIRRSSEELLWIFVQEYDMKNYYSRNWNAGYHKTEKYYAIMKYIFEHYEMKNLMDYIAKNEFYSKSYITHLFKQVSASSFQDVLTYIRLYHSERLLLDSEVPIVEIASRCGFSDIKYYTSNFKKWFLRTPSEYRKTYQPEVAKRSLFQRLRTEDFIDRVETLVRNADDTRYKAAVNPIVIKTAEQWTGALAADIPELRTADAPESQAADVPELHEACIPIGEETDLPTLFSWLTSFQAQGFVPVLLIDSATLSPSRCRKLLSDCAQALAAEAFLFPELEVILAYHSPAEKGKAAALLQDAEQYKRLRLKPMLILKTC